MCEKSFFEPEGLRNHLIYFHTNKDERRFGCDQCPKRFVSRYKLNVHMAIHIPREEWKIPCDLCPQPKYFPSERALQCHKINSHEKPVSMCHVCGKKVQYGKFAKHVRSHSNNNPRVKCTIPGCDTWLKDDENLKKHLNRHRRKGQTHPCSICNKVFQNSEGLVGHIRYNHSDITYECKYCNKIFKRPRNLKEHMAAQHTGQFLYQCSFCERKFNSNSNLCTHMKKEHPLEHDLWKRTKFCSLATKI